MEQNRHTREEWAEMEMNALKAGNAEAAAHFRDMQSRLVATQPTAAQKAMREQMDDMAREAAENDPDWMMRALSGGFETPISTAANIVLAPAAGLTGVGKAGYNVLARALGGKPEDAAEAVRWVQSLGYQPKGVGGKAGMEALGYPFQKIHELGAEPGGRLVAEHGGGPLLGSLTETALDAVPQLVGGEGMVRAMPKSLRETVAGAAGRAGLPRVQSAFTPKPRNVDIKELARVGSVPTMGQRWSQNEKGIAKQLGRLEELAMRNPYWGGHIRAARERATKEWNYGMLNDARTVVGLKRIEPGEMSLNDALEKTENDLSDRYDELLARMQGDAFADLGPPGPGGGGRKFNLLPRPGGPPGKRMISPGEGGNVIDMATGKPINLDDLFHHPEMYAVPDVDPTLTPGEKAWADTEGREAAAATEKFGWPGAVEQKPEVDAAMDTAIKGQQPLFPDAPVSPHTAGPPAVPPKGGLPANVTRLPPPPTMRRNFITDIVDLLQQSRRGARRGEKGELIELTTDQDKKTFALLLKAIHDRMTTGHYDASGKWISAGKFDGGDLKQISQWIQSAKLAARKSAARGDVSGQLAPYIERLQQSFRDMISVTNPIDAQVLRAHDMAWSQYKIVQDALTTRAGGAKPWFSPAAGMAAVRRRAMKRGEEGKTLLGKGQAQGQKLAGAAERVLGPKVMGESPTAEAMLALGESASDILAGGDPVTGLVGRAGQLLAGNILGQYFFYSKPYQRWLLNNYLRGHANLPFTNIHAGKAFTRGLPAGTQEQRRAQEYMDEKMRSELQGFGINPDMVK